jgi:DNA repair protein RadC
MTKDNKWFLGEVKVTYNRRTNDTKTQVTNSNVAAEFFRTIINADIIEHHEEMWVAYLNRANRVIGFMQLSSGGLAGTVCDTRILFQGALLCNAQSMILMHNHPSGQAKPSDEDIKLTRSVKEAGKIMDITLTDHLILTYDSYYSFADEGQL